MLQLFCRYNLLLYLFFYISTFRNVCAMPNKAVFCSFLISCSLVMFFRHIFNDFELVPIVPVITGIISVFTFHMRCISTVRYSYLRIFAASSVITFLSPEIVKSISTYVPVFIITDYDVRFIAENGSVGLLFSIP